MSALAWLFGLGALTIAFPLLFHLIRRTPKGQTEFSSLMFLKPTPATLTRRSRLENILLLLMRAAAIALIAFAFMRPYFRGADSLSEVELANRRVAILVDVSASMQRAGLWDQAKKQVDEVLANLESGDDVALFSFDKTLETIVDFADRDESKVDRADLIRKAVETLEPGWQRSDLGKALVSSADQLDVWRDSQQSKSSGMPAKLQIVVVSDLQKGSKVEALQSYQWPSHVYVKFNPVVPADLTNATVQLLNTSEEEDEPSIRIRVSNSQESTTEQFFVSWSGKDQTKSNDPISFYVPAGTSRVMKVSPDETISAREFVVSGDTEDFDNNFFTVPIEQQVLNVTYIGDDDSDDPEHPQYYLRRAFVESPARSVKVSQVKGDEKIDMASAAIVPTMVVLASSPTDSQRESVDEYLNSGGTLVVVLADEKMADSTTDWTSSRLKESSDSKKNSRDDYQMLAEIDFANPLFQAFSNPRYNDFTKIRFWNHRSVEIIDDEVDVIARFENDDPAVWHRRFDTGGQIYTFASGWQPSQSQLALSTKFVPLINGLVEIAADLPELKKSLLVGDRIEFPIGDSFTKRRLVKPDGTAEPVEADQTSFNEVDLPGIYRLESLGATSTQSGDGANVETDSSANVDQNSGPSFLFAINVDRAESSTGAIPIESIEMFAVKVGEQETAATELAQMREMRDRDIESSQKVWKWLIVAALILLIGEILLAGQTDSRMIAGDSTSAPTVSGEPT